MPSVFYIRSSYIQNCLFGLFFVQLLLNRICNFLAYVFAMFVASASKLSWIRGEDASTGDSKSSSRLIEYATANFLIVSSYFYLFLVHFIELLFSSVAGVCEAQLRLFVYKINQQYIDLDLSSWTLLSLAIFL